jgi:hypothetical protein
MQFQCALKVGEKFPRMNLRFMKEEEKKPLVCEKGKKTLSVYPRRDHNPQIMEFRGAHAKF